MSQLKAFIEKAQSDKELMAKLDELGAKDAGADEIIALAKENGFTITADEIENQKRGELATGELSEEELETVAGGEGGPTMNRYDPKTCKNMVESKYNCMGFLGWCWCDHFRRRHDPTTETGTYRSRYFHSCVMGAFPEYRGDNYGFPKPGKK